MHEIQHSILHVDKGILFTIKELFTRPGNTIKEYIDGKRQKHFKPILLILILGTISAFMKNKFLPKENDFISIKEVKDKDIIVDGGEKIQVDQYVEWIKNIANWIDGHYGMTILLFIPVFSLGFYWAFKKYKVYNYAEFLVITTFLLGQALVINIISIPIISLIPNFKEWSYIIILLAMAFSVYQIFNNQKTIHVIGRAILAAFLSFSIFALVVGVLFTVGIMNFIK